ncbi:MAG: M48 family metallopeptidase [Planctomycetota bacterium]
MPDAFHNRCRAVPAVLLAALLLTAPSFAEPPAAPPPPPGGPSDNPPDNPPSDRDPSGDGVLPELDAAGIRLIEAAVKLFHTGGLIAEMLIADLVPLTPEELSELGAEMHGVSVAEMPVVAAGPHVERANRLAEFAIRDAQWPKEWIITVIDVDGPVAFAHVGGYVYLGTGLMDALNDDELLFVLGHEVGHIEKQHTDRIWSYAKTLRDFGDPDIADFITVLTVQHLRVGYSEHYELEADIYGIEVASRHGVTVDDAISALTIVADMVDESLEERPRPANSGDAILIQLEEHYRTHPHTIERIQALREWADAR